MKIPDVPFTITNWSAIEPAEQKGSTGASLWRTLEARGLRVRMVRYSLGFRSDHWCPRGHVLLVIEGEIGVSLKDGRTFRLAKGMSFQAGDDEANPHLVHSERGATVFIVD